MPTPRHTPTVKPMIPVIDPKIGSDGAPPREVKAPDGWHEHRGEWRVMREGRIATVFNFECYREIAVFAGVTTETDYVSVLHIPVATPRQLLDAMIRADRFVAGGE